MKKEHLRPFYEEWTKILTSDLKSGDDPEEAPSSLLQETLDSYQSLLQQTPLISLEKALMDAFSFQEFAGFERYFPKMYRGIPRLYNPNAPSQSYTKKNFSSLESLKRQMASPALFSLYDQYEISGSITLFAWIVHDATAVYRVMQILQECLPDVKVKIVLLVEKKLIHKVRMKKDILAVIYEKHCPVQAISTDILKVLRNSSVILQMPNFYPSTNHLLQTLAKIPSEKPMPKMELLGECGFSDSIWFHPKSGAYSMGLHFLEKGVLTYAPKQKYWTDLQNTQIQKWRNPKNRFYLADLPSSSAGAIYLHALLKFLENENQDIDICTPDLKWFIRFTKDRQNRKLPVLEGDFGVKSIEVQFRQDLYVISIGKRGKAVRFLVPDALSDRDLETLLALSDPFTAIGDVQLFSKTISYGQPFFYYGKAHSLPFVKDLIALAENRLQRYPGTLQCIRAMFQAFLHELPVQTESLVEETFFQPLEKWSDIAMSMGKALQAPETFSGFQKFCKIIVEEFSANSFICHLVKRALVHRKFPEIAQKEEEEMQAFLTNAQSFAQTLHALKVLKKETRKLDLF